MRLSPIGELIGKPPKWLVKWGMLTVVFSLGLLIILSFKIELKNSTSLRFELAAISESMTIISPNSGTFHLLYKEGDSVKKDSVICSIITVNNVSDKSLMPTEVITAPYDGTIFLERNFFSGSYLDSGKKIMTIYREPIKLIAAASTDYKFEFTEGEQCLLRFRKDKHSMESFSSGRILSIRPDSQGYQLVIDVFDPKSLGFAPGRSVEVEFVNGKKKLIEFFFEAFHSKVQ